MLRLLGTRQGPAVNYPWKMQGRGRPVPSLRMGVLGPARLGENREGAGVPGLSLSTSPVLRPGLARGPGRSGVAPRPRGTSCAART